MLALASGCVCRAGLTTLADWTYQSASISGALSSFGPITPENGSGWATGVHGSSSTEWSGTSGSTYGNGSTKSFNSSHWAIDDYYQFQITTIGYQNITIAWDQASSSTGPIKFKLQYSTDGSTFNDYTSYTVNTDASSWSSGSTISADHYSYDLSSITAIDNASAIYFRLTDITNPSSNNGTDRNDNFLVLATPVPEPAWGEFSGAGLLAMCGVRLWRQRRPCSAAVG